MGALIYDYQPGDIRYQLHEYGLVQRSLLIVIISRVCQVSQTLFQHLCVFLTQHFEPRLFQTYG